MSKITINHSSGCFGYPSFYLAYFASADNEFEKEERIYCAPEKIDGHWLIRVSERKKGQETQVVNPTHDKVIAVTSHLETLSSKILEATRAHAKAQLDVNRVPHYSRLEDNTQ
jgi:hypothetical protein